MDLRNLYGPRADMGDYRSGPRSVHPRSRWIERRRAHCLERGDVPAAVRGAAGGFRARILADIGVDSSPEKTGCTESTAGNVVGGQRGGSEEQAL